MDPHLVAAILSAATTLVTGAGIARNRVAARGLAKRRASFVEGLPRFEKSVKQDRLAAALERLGRERDALAALASATPHLSLPTIPPHPHRPEVALVELVDGFMQDARTSLALVCGEEGALSVLRDDPEAFAALSSEGLRAVEARPSLASARARVLAHAEATTAMVAKLARAEGFRPGSLEDHAITMAHAGALGALGAKVGATLGTLVMPGVGTVLGTALGGIAVGVGGATAARERMKREHEAENEARKRASQRLAECVHQSSAHALLAIERASQRSRAALDAARAEADSDVLPSSRVGLRVLVDDLLRALSWRLDEGASLLDSDGDFLRADQETFLTRRTRNAEVSVARNALDSKKRSHSRATEALKSALKVADPLKALGWVVFVPLPSHPDVDAIFDKLVTVLTESIDEETRKLRKRRATLATAWASAVRLMFEAMDAELRRHASERERVLAELVRASSD